MPESKISREEQAAGLRARWDQGGVDELRVEVERLRAWKAEALPVMAGLQDLGRVLGVGLGERITGEAAAEKAHALVAEVEAVTRARNYAMRQRDDERAAKEGNIRALNAALARAEAAERERDLLRARVPAPARHEMVPGTARQRWRCTGCSWHGMGDELIVRGIWRAFHARPAPESEQPGEHEHGDWDQGGYCNRLVLDDDGSGTVCGYRPAPVHSHGPEEGRGTACPERRLPDGTLQGACIAPVVPDRADAEAVARLFHDTYERLAPEFGYRTREASAKPWDEVPEQNRALMVETVRQVLAVVSQGVTAEAVRARLYTPEGQVRQEVQDEVGAAIRRYPNIGARSWLGGVAAVKAVYHAAVRPTGQGQADG